jgi:hypothetical protein
MKLVRTLPKFNVLIPEMQTFQCVGCGYVDTIAAEQKSGARSPAIRA